MSNTPQDRDEEQWLDAVAGRPSPSGEPPSDAQAIALRKALQDRRDRLGEQVPAASSMLYDQIRFRLRREGLGAKRPLGLTSPVWGWAASVVMAVALAVQITVPSTNRGDDQQITRGDSDTILIVEDPEARLAELIAGLNAAGEKPERSLVLKIRATDAVREYLSTQRIDAKKKDGYITLVLKSSASKR